jgi:hypothetical protein
MTDLNNIPNETEWLQVVQTKVEGIRFGLVQIVVHEGKVTQIEVTEKTRLESGVAKTSR